MSLLRPRSDRLPTGATILTTPSLIAKVREGTELIKGTVGGDRVSDRALGYVLGAVGGDVDLAISAITMQPRPEWVREFLGPSSGQVAA